MQKLKFGGNGRASKAIKLFDNINYKQKNTFFFDNETKLHAGLSLLFSVFIIYVYSKYLIKRI